MSADGPTGLIPAILAGLTLRGTGLLNGRPPRRPNTATWCPVSSTARSRSSPFEIASAGPPVWCVAMSCGAGRGLKPKAPGVSFAETSCTTCNPLTPSAMYANTLALVIATFTSRESLIAPPAVNVWSTRGRSGRSTSTITSPSEPAATYA